MTPTNGLEWIIDGALLGAAVSLPRWGIGLAIAAVGLGLLMPHATKVARAIGAGLAAIGTGVIFASLPWEGEILTRALFYVLTAITLVSAVGAVSSRAAIYCAVWFAATLLGVAGLLMLSGAQFLGVATIVVYAGAIVVTFLFVIMLAQPQGNESYDRVSWGSMSRPAAIFASAALVASSISAQQNSAQQNSAQQNGVWGGLREEVTTIMTSTPRSEAYPDVQAVDVVASRLSETADGKTLHITLRESVFSTIEDADSAEETDQVAARRAQQEQQKAGLAAAFLATADEMGTFGFDPVATTVEFDSAGLLTDPLATNHVELLGVHLFGNQLIAVQVTGVLLLVALVGAISILTQDAPAPRRGEAAL